jgi:hypothetical protein
MENSPFAIVQFAIRHCAIRHSPLCSSPFAIVQFAIRHCATRQFAIVPRKVGAKEQDNLIELSYKT